ncbi:hypothetical protein BDW66DRAFT_135659 [Aspergillus desertorum]
MTVAVAEIPYGHFILVHRVLVIAVFPIYRERGAAVGHIYSVYPYSGVNILVLYTIQEPYVLTVALPMICK